MLKLFSNHIGSDKDFKDVTREQVLEFLNQRKNSSEDDPENSLENVHAETEKGPCLEGENEP